MLSRGHLSRPACSHVKRVAKRPGTREPGRDISPGRFFVGDAHGTEKWIPAFGRGHAPGSEEAANVRVDQELPPRNPAGPCRYSSITVRRDLGGIVSYPRLRLFDRRGLRGTFL